MSLKKWSRVVWSKLLDYTPLTIKDSGAARPFVAVIYSVSRIGDGIACSIPIKAITRKYNNSRVFVICSKYNVASFEHVPNITLITVSDDKSYAQIFLAALKIKRQNFVDLVFEPSASRSIGPLIFMRTLKAYRNITFRNTAMKMLTQVPQDAEVSVRVSHVKAMHSAEIEVEDDAFSFYLDALAESKIKEFLFKHSITKYIAINLYGFDKKRKIDNETAIKLIQKIRSASNVKIMLLCSPQTSSDVCFLSSKFDDVFYFAETKTIHDSASIIKYSKCLISPDTSLVHIASAFNIPTLAIFLDEINYMHWPPTATGSQSILCEKMSDIPCDKVASFVNMF